MSHDLFGPKSFFLTEIITPKTHLYSHSYCLIIFFDDSNTFNMHSTRDVQVMNKSFLVKLKLMNNSCFESKIKCFN